MPAPAVFRNRLAFVACALLLFSPLRAQDGYVFTTLTLSPAPDASESIQPLRPLAMAFHPSGDLYFTATSGVGKISITGVVTMILRVGESPGIVDGSFGTAQLSRPSGLGFAPDGAMYITDLLTIRRISLVDQRVTTVAGGAPMLLTTDQLDGIGTRAIFVFPVAITFNRAGYMLISDGLQCSIRMMSPEFEVTTYAGPNTFQRLAEPLGAIRSEFGSRDGDRTTARFAFPSGIAIDSSGTLFIDDRGNATIRKITADGIVSTLAGQPGSYGTLDGMGSAARFGKDPSTNITTAPFQIGAGLAVDPAGDVIFVDTDNHRIRKITPAGLVSTIGGGDYSGRTDGYARDARFYLPGALAIDSAGNLFIADTGNGTIRKGTPAWRPAFTTAPQSQSVAAGQNVTLSVVVTGTPAPTLQWTKDGAAIAGATNATLTLTNVQTANTGSYALVATNVAGSVTSTAAGIRLGVPPVITTHPVSQSIQSGDTLTLSVVATGAVSVQWLKDGVNIPGATNATYTVPAVSTGAAGNYSAVLTNADGSATSSVATVIVQSSRIANLSIRTNLTPAAPMLTVGFVVAGNGKRLLVRGVGPTLAQFGLSGVLANPRATLFTGDRVMAANDDWGKGANASQIATTSGQVGAFALAPDSADAVLLADFDGGGYSAQITGAAGTSGIVLVELYDADATSASKLVNVSARAQVGTGDDVLFAGFVISGTARKTLLIRAVGPTLASFGVDGTLANPKLDVIRAGATAPVATNDDWSGTAELTAAFTAQGAFPFASADSKDAALLLTLEPGNYSVQVSGVGGTTGEALVEIYDVR